ncbi:MAG: S-adenosylmethionine decarboxylase [Nanoarchaeota archaeon]
MSKKNLWWGRSVSLNLHGCEPKLLKDPKALEYFAHKLSKLLRMKRMGPTEVKRFGHGDLRGYSMIQFIETSSIVAHFDEKGQRAFIDVFSCKKYNPKIVIKFCKDYFKAKSLSTLKEERV